MKGADPKPRRCAECGQEFTSLPYIAGIAKRGEWYVNIETCSRECQKTYQSKNEVAAHQPQE